MLLLVRRNGILNLLAFMLLMLVQLFGRQIAKSVKMQSDFGRAIPVLRI
jgi:hypothetical protein